MADHNDFGKLAEDLSVEYLQKNGYTILERNFRWQKAEIDIIAEFENQIIIIEVKARANDHFMEPQEAVKPGKIRSIVKAADYFMSAKNLQKEVRFDIVSVLKNPDGSLQITHLPDAFEAFDAN